MYARCVLTTDNRTMAQVVYALMYFRAKCLLKVIFFVYSDLEHSSDEKKKGLNFFNSLNL